MLVNNFNQAGFGREQFNSGGIQKPTDIYMLQVLQQQEIEAVHSRRIDFNFEFNTFTCQWACNVLDKIEEIDDEERKLALRPERYKPEKITIKIGSVGGSVLDACGLWNKMEQLKEKGYIIATHTDTYSISCGFMTYILGSKGHRTMSRHAKLLCHQLSSICRGTLEDLQRGVTFDTKLWEEMEKIILENTKMTKEMLDDMKRTNLDWWMSPEEAKKLGCTDRII